MRQFTLGSERVRLVSLAAVSVLLVKVKIKYFAMLLAVAEN